MGFGALEYYQERSKRKYVIKTVILTVLSVIIFLSIIFFDERIKYISILYSIYLFYKYLIKTVMYYPPLIMVSLINVFVNIIIFII